MNEEDQSQMKKKESDKLTTILSLTDRIFLLRSEADPTNYYKSCEEAEEIINDIMKAPLMYYEVKHKVWTKCFACNDTGGLMVFELLINKGIIDIEEALTRSADLSGLISEGDVTKYIEMVQKITEPDFDVLKKRFIDYYIDVAKNCPRRKEANKLSEVRDAVADELRASAKRVVISSKE